MNDLITSLVFDVDTVHSEQFVAGKKPRLIHVATRNTILYSVSPGLSVQRVMLLFFGARVSLSVGKVQITSTRGLELSGVRRVLLDQPLTKKKKKKLRRYFLEKCEAVLINITIFP
jgi:hypothetical protein